MNSRFPIFALFAAAAWFCGLGAQPASAQRKAKEPELAPAPPPAVAREVSVRPGETVDIPLGIHGERPGQVQFVIRNRPKLGTLSKVASTGRNSALVQYTAGEQAGEDSFLYAASTQDGVSAPAKVRVTVIVAPMLPARLVVEPDSVNFPGIILGEQASATLEASNRGGSIAEGVVKVPAPWKIEGPADYRIPPGKSWQFKIVFEPEAAGDFSGEASFGPTPKRIVPLQAVAKAPLEVAAKTVELEAAPGSATRAGKLQVVNHSTKPQKITIKAGARLMLSESVTVPPGEKAELPVFASAEDVSAVDEKVQLEAGAWKEEVAVRGKAFPARVKFLAESLDFGKSLPGELAEATAVLENTGGQPAIASLRVDAPFEISAAGLQVPPRGTAKVPVKVRAPSTGPVKGTLVADIGGVKQTVQLTLAVAEAPKPPAPAGRAAPAPKVPSFAQQQPRQAVAGSGEKQTGSLRLAAPMPSVAEAPARMGRYTRDVHSRGAVLEWPSQMGAGKAIAVLERSIGVSADGTVYETWSQVNGVRLAEANGKRTAEVTGLKPDRHYVMRVTAGGEPLFTAQFATPPSRSWISLQGVLITALVVIFGIIVWWRIKNRVSSGW